MKECKKIFSLYGIPVELRLGCGPQFGLLERPGFQIFVNMYNISVLSVLL